MFSLAKNALSRLQVQSIQPTMARQSHQKPVPDVHDKYGNAVLACGAIFCIAVWTYPATRTGRERDLSSVGRVTPKEWRNP
uniref:cytochrome c oxidase subunit 7B, mitochondrial-like n=1 Tax=Ictidomys tridecemlineatus TaxID=43179 RepID=UPI00038C4F1E|nr:cytochrome c oxidase subunit 7B, mitochondrial-like [Ictidomys tridecemlineatus]